MSLTTKDETACFGGKLLKQTHEAKSTKCVMTFNIFLPKETTQGKKVPLVIFMGGMTCTEDNGAQKGFLQNGGQKHGIAILYPDTSPRNCNVPGEDDSWDFGTGSGYYLNATNPPYTTNYNMYTYITEELPSVISQNYSDVIDLSRISLTGNSMGGHGALTIFLKNPGKYKSVSAYCPIANPLKCGWGEKAFKGYFGEEQWQEKGKEHDATELVKGWKGDKLDILIDVGTEDSFGKQGQLLAENFVEAAKSNGQQHNITLRMQPGYGHNFYFVASFADDHMDHHAKYLNA